MLPRQNMGEYLTLPSLEASKNIENGISMQENLLWANFCASRGTRVIEPPLRGLGRPAKKVRFWLGRQFLTKMCPSHFFLDALSNGNIPD